MYLPGSACQEATEIIRGCGPTACPASTGYLPKTAATARNHMSRHRQRHAA